MNVYDGGLDAAAKKLMIETLTNAIAETIDLPKDRMRPIYVVIRNVPAINWGFFGKVITIEDLLASDPNWQPV